MALKSSQDRRIKERVLPRSKIRENRFQGRTITQEDRITENSDSN